MGSEFGQGLCYNLGLFLAHTGEIDFYRKSLSDENRAYSMWFYAAADHLYDFEWKDAPTKHLRNRCAEFRHKILSLRLPMGEQAVATKKDFEWATQEAKDLLRFIDKANGVEVTKGNWE